MKVFPVPGRAVRDPKNMQLLPDEGREVPDGDPFWVRRVRDGDVTVEGAATEAKPEPQHQAHGRHHPQQEPRREA